MIDTDKYEGHTEGPWRTAEGQPYDDEGSHLDIEGANGVLVTETSYFTDDDHPNVQLMADAPLLLEEVKRLQKLEAAVVGSWLETINRGSVWHKQLRGPCVELGYLTRDVMHWYELSEEYQDMAKQWVREWYGDEEE